MQGVQTTTTPKCATLESPKRSYDVLLFRINSNFGEKEMDHFEFAFRNELPKRILEVRQPLKWFSELEQRDMLSLDNLSCIANFLQLVSHNTLLEEVCCYQGRRRTVVFFQRNLERKIHGLCLDEKFTQHWTSEQRLPRNFLRRCHDFFRGIQSTPFTVKDLSCLASKGINLLVKSCQPSESHRDLDSIAFKTLYFSNLFFERFHEMIIKHRDLLKLKSAPLGSAARCPLPRNNRRPVDRHPQSEVTYEMERPKTEERPSSDKLVLFTMVLILSLVFPLLVGLMIWWKESENIGLRNKK